MTNRAAKVEIRTSDTDWAASRPIGRDGRVIADVVITGERTIGYTGQYMVFFDYVGEPPTDCTPHGFAPYEWVV